MIRPICASYVHSYLASLAVGGDEGGVGGGGGLGAVGQHTLVHAKRVLRLPAAVAGADDRVVRAHLWLGALRSAKATSARRLQTKNGTSCIFG